MFEDMFEIINDEEAKEKITVRGLAVLQAEFCNINPEDYGEKFKSKTLNEIGGNGSTFGLNVMNLNITTMMDLIESDSEIVAILNIKLFLKLGKKINIFEEKFVRDLTDTIEYYGISYCKICLNKEYKFGVDGVDKDNNILSEKIKYYKNNEDNEDRFLELINRKGYIAFKARPELKNRKIDFSNLQ